MVFEFRVNLLLKILPLTRCHRGQSGGLIICPLVTVECRIASSTDANFIRFSVTSSLNFFFFDISFLLKGSIGSDLDKTNVYFMLTRGKRYFRLETRYTFAGIIQETQK